jgi:osmotically-inducible protein OsmY
VHYLSGVKGVSNNISLKPKLTTMAVETAIQSAFKRSALFDASKIQVKTSQNEVVLSGKVRNYSELEEAERAAWAAPGVFSVDNNLTLESFGFDT